MPDSDYIESVLEDDEPVLYRCKVCWRAIPDDVVDLIKVLPGLGLGLLISYGFAQMFPINYLVTGGILVYFTFWVIKRILLRFSGWEMAITDRRLVVVSDVFSREIKDTPLWRIGTVRVQQSYFGRIFDYGQLVISGAGFAIRTREIHDPVKARRLLDKARAADRERHFLERQAMYRRLNERDHRLSPLRRVK